ncbi:MAG: hypothetical protein U0166_25660 [Acidobacteriota bacterium]
MGGEDDVAARDGLARQLEAETRLAAPARAARDHDAAALPSEIVESFAEDRERVVAGDERRAVEVGPAHRQPSSARGSRRPFVRAPRFRGAGARPRRVSGGKDALEPRGERERRSETPRRRLLEQAQDDVVELPRKAVARRGYGLRAQVLDDDVRRRGSDEGRASDEELVDHAAERVEIGARVDQVSSCLLGSDRVDAAGDLALHLERIAADGGEPRREAEVDDDGTQGGVAGGAGHGFPEEHVVELQVPVDDPLAVQVGERVAEVPREREDLGDQLGWKRLDRPLPRRSRVAHDVDARCGSLPEAEAHRRSGRSLFQRIAVVPEPPGPRPQRLARDEIHRVPGEPVVETFADDAHDAGVGEPRERHHLAPHTLHMLRSGDAHRLERRALICLGVDRLVDDAHPASAERGQEAERSDARGERAGAGRDQ